MPGNDVIHPICDRWGRQRNFDFCSTIEPDRTWPYMLWISPEEQKLRVRDAQDNDWIDIGGSGGGGAPSDAPYLVLALDPALSAERRLIAGDGLQATDAGPNGDYTLAVKVADFAGAGLEDDGSNNLRIATAAAGDGLTGGGGDPLAVDSTVVRTSGDQTIAGLKTFENNVILDDGAGDSPEIQLIGGSNNDKVRIYLEDNAVAGKSDLIIRLPGTSGECTFAIQTSGGSDRVVFYASGYLYVAGGLQGTDLLLTGGVNLVERTTPASSVNRGWIYVKDHGGDTELYYLDDEGKEVQLTIDGYIGPISVGDGLTGGAGSPLAVAVADFAGTGLEDDGANNLRIAAAAAGDGLTGGGGDPLAVDSTVVRTTGAQSIAGSKTLTDNLILANGVTVGQAAGPLLTFDDTLNQLRITGCKVGIEAANPLRELHIDGTARIEEPTGFNDLLGVGSALYRYHNGDGYGPYMAFRRFKGTPESPLAVDPGTYLGKCDFQGFDGTEYDSAARFSAVVDGNVARYSVPTAFIIETGVWSTALYERLRITSGGKVGIGTSAPGSLMEWNMADQDVEFVDAHNASGVGSISDVIEVQIGGVTGYISVHSTYS